MVEDTSEGHIIIPGIKNQTSSSIAFNDGTITRATLTADETKVGNDSFTYMLSADGGSNWEQVTNGTEHAFANTGVDLRVKVIGVGTGGANTYIDYLKIKYG